MRIVVWFLPSCITASTGYSYTTGNVECFRHNLTWSNTSLCWHSVTDHLHGTWFYDTLSFYNVKQSSRCDPSFILPNLVSGFCPCRPEKYIRMFFFLGTDRFSCETMNMFSLQPFSDQLTPEIQIYIPPHYISHTHTLWCDVCSSATADACSVTKALTFIKRNSFLIYLVLLVLPWPRMSSWFHLFVPPLWLKFVSEISYCGDRLTWKTANSPELMTTRLGTSILIQSMEAVTSSRV